MKLTLTLFVVGFFIQVASGQSKLIDSLQSVVAQHPSDTVGINASLNLANEYLRKDSDKAKLYLYEVLKVTQSRGLSHGQSAAYAYLVTLNQNSGRLDSATYYLNLLEDNSKNSSNTKNKINYFQTAGLFYKNQGQYRKALPFMAQALELNTIKGESYAGKLLNRESEYLVLKT